MTTHELIDLIAALRTCRALLEKRQPPPEDVPEAIEVMQRAEIALMGVPPGSPGHRSRSRRAPQEPSG
jgi:hypothetical protein